MASVGIVLPAFRPDVERLRVYAGALDARLAPETIRIELDAPTEATAAAVEEFAAEMDAVSVHTASERRGKGAAITAGFEALSTDVLAFADADGATPAGSVAAVVEAATDGADLAVGSRRHPDADVWSHQTYGRRWLGDAFAWLARRLLAADLYDYQCGAKAITADAWRDVRGHLYESGFAWDIELIAMAAALGAEIEEVPVAWEDQPESTVAPVSTTIELGLALFASRHRAKLLAESPIHEVIAARRESQPSLIDRLAAEEPDE